MSTFSSIRQNLRLIEGGLWHTLSDVRPTVVSESEKTLQTGVSERSAGVLRMSDAPRLGSKLRSGRRRRMARTYVILAFGLGLGACSQAEYRDAQSRVAPMSVKKPGPVAAPFIPCTLTPAGDPGHDRVWAACMSMHKPNGRHPPAQLLFTDWRD
jgi:hypothetical protein